MPDNKLWTNIFFNLILILTPWDRYCPHFTGKEIWDLKTFEKFTQSLRLITQASNIRLISEIMLLITALLLIRELNTNWNKKKLGVSSSERWIYIYILVCQGCRNKILQTVAQTIETSYHTILEAGLISSEASLLRLYMTSFLLCLHMVFLLRCASLVSQCVQISFYRDISRIRLRPTLMASF